MFCGKCGAKNEDNAQFCAKCGAKLDNVVPMENVDVSSPDVNNKNRKVGIIAVAVVAVLVILLGVFLLGGRSYKATIKKFVNAQFEADVKGVFDLVPEKMIDGMLEKEGYNRSDLDDLLDEVDDSLESMVKSLDSYLGEGWKVTYEILDTEDIKGDDLNDIKDAYKDVDVKVSAAKKVEIELTLKGDEEDTSYSMDIYLLKVGRSWYIDLMNMGNLF